MIPTQVPEPFHRDGWVYEEKVDGWRIVAYKDRDRVRLVRRHSVDHTRRFRDLAAENQRSVTLSGSCREPAVVLSGRGDVRCPAGGHPR